MVEVALIVLVGLYLQYACYQSKKTGSRFKNVTEILPSLRKGGSRRKNLGLSA